MQLWNRENCFCLSFWILRYWLCFICFHTFISFLCFLCAPIFVQSSFTQQLISYHLSSLNVCCVTLDIPILCEYLFVHQRAIAYSLTNTEPYHYCQQSTLMYCLRVINEMCLSGEKEKKKYYHCTNNRRDLILEPYSIGYDRQNSFLLFLFIVLFFVKCYTNCIVRFIATIRCNYFFSLSYFIIQHLKPIELDFACCWKIWFSLHLHMQRHLSNPFFFVYQIILESAPKINSLTYQLSWTVLFFCSSKRLVDPIC